jgi:hypothetical protein
MSIDTISNLSKQMNCIIIDETRFQHKKTQTCRIQIITRNYRGQTGHTSKIKGKDHTALLKLGSHYPYVWAVRMGRGQRLEQLLFYSFISNTQMNSDLASAGLVYMNSWN